MAGGIFTPIFKKGKVKNMKFTEALKNMKKGIPMKLPSWGGYWYWDPEKETIMMKCRAVDSDTGKDLLDIRETQRVEYTLTNVLSDEWIPATEENTTILGGTPTFSFGDAIKYMKRGLKVKRQGWNGKNQHIELARNISYVTSDGSVQNCEHEAIGNMAIAFVGTSGVQMGCLLLKLTCWLKTGFLQSREAVIQMISHRRGMTGTAKEWCD